MQTTTNFTEKRRDLINEIISHSYHRGPLKQFHILESHPLRDMWNPTCWNPRSKKGRFVLKTCNLLQSVALRPSTCPGQCSMTVQTVEKQNFLYKTIRKELTKEEESFNHEIIWQTDRQTDGQISTDKNHERFFVVQIRKSTFAISKTSLFTQVRYLLIRALRCSLSFSGISSSLSIVSSFCKSSAV